MLYPCSYCNKHSGPNSFKRQDHLSQHLRGYHNIDSLVKSPDHGKRKPPKKPKASKLSCPHVDCPYHQDTPTLDRENTRKYFDSRKDFTEHLREIHDESPYSCDFPRCGRIRGRGFFRRRDLLKHQKYHDRDWACVMIIRLAGCFHCWKKLGATIHVIRGERGVSDKGVLSEDLAGFGLRKPKVPNLSIACSMILFAGLHTNSFYIRITSCTPCSVPPG
jgi:hypothetical protein